MKRCIALQINETVFQVMALNVVNLDEGIYVELAGVIEVTGGLGLSDVFFLMIFFIGRCATPRTSAIHRSRRISWTFRKNGCKTYA